MQHSIEPLSMQQSEHATSILSVYLVVPHPEKGEEWVQFGSAEPHADGRGFNLVLQPIPANAKVVLRAKDTMPRAEIERGSLAQQVDAFERATIERCLAASGGKIIAVMEQLNIPRRPLSEKMVRFGIERRRFVVRAGESRPMRTNDIGEDAPAAEPGCFWPSR